MTFPLPANPELERLVLGSLLLSGNVPLAQGVLDDFCFSNDINRKLWSVMLEVHNSGMKVDRVTVAQRAKDLGLEKLLSFTFIISLDEDLPQVLNLDDYIRHLKDFGVRRQAMLTMEGLIAKLADTSNNSAELLGAAARLNESLSVAAQPERSVLTCTQVIDEAGGLDGFLSRASVSNAIPTPWQTVQDRFIGFCPGQLYLLAGRPSMGKTALMLQMVWHVALLGAHPLVISLEMSRESLINRMLSCQAKVPLWKIMHQRMNRDEMRAVAAIASSEVMRRIRLTDDSLVSVPLVRSRIMKLNPRPELVAVDYLQLMVSQGRNRNDEVSSISRGLKLTAKECKTAMLALSQMSRPEGKDEERAPTLSSLRDSGSLEQDADMVSFVWGKRPKEDADVREVFFDMQKQRNGPLAKILLSFNGGVQRFEEFCQPREVPPFSQYLEPEDLD